MSDESGYSMLPEDMSVFARHYNPTEDLILNNAAEHSTSSLTPVKVKEIKLLSPINSDSLFRFKFDAKCSGGAATYAQVYKNGVAIGMLQETVSATYVTITEDINTQNWYKGDLIELYYYTSDMSHPAWVKNFCLYGYPSEFGSTLGA